MNNRGCRNVTDNNASWANKNGQGLTQKEVGAGRQIVSDLSRVSQALFNRSNSFPASFCSNNEESYFVNFDQITAMGEDQLNPFVESIRDANTLFLDDNISFIGSKETDSYFDNTSKYQRSVTMDFSNNSKYPGICSYYPRNMDSIDYSRSNSDLTKYLEKDELQAYNGDNSLTRDSSGSGADGSGRFIYGYPNGCIEYGGSADSTIDSKHRTNCFGVNYARGVGVSSPKREMFVNQSDNLSSLTSDQLKDIGFINKQSNKRRSKRGYTPVKLFVNRVPKYMTNDELLKIFNKYGIVVECNIIRDSNGPKGCAFVRFSNIYEAQNAILCIHGKTVLDKEVGPIQVKYADGEIERLGLSPDVQPCGESVKVFVGSLPKNCTEERLLLLFKQFGHVDEVHIIRDNNKQSKCSAFVTFPRKFMAENAIMFLDKKYIFDNSKRPIEVRLAKSRAKQKQQLQIQQLQKQLIQQHHQLMHQHQLIQKQRQKQQNAGCKQTSSLSPSDSDFASGSLGFGLQYGKGSCNSPGMQGIIPLRGGETDMFDSIPDVSSSQVKFSNISNIQDVDALMQNLTIGLNPTNNNSSYNHGNHLNCQNGGYLYANSIGNPKMPTSMSGIGTGNINSSDIVHGNIISTNKAADATIAKMATKTATMGNPNITTVTVNANATNTDLNAGTGTNTSAAGKRSMSSSLLVGGLGGMNSSNNKQLADPSKSTNTTTATTTATAAAAAVSVVQNIKNLDHHIGRELTAGGGSEPNRGMHMGSSHSSLMSDSCHKGSPKSNNQIKFTPPTLLDFWAKPILNV